MRTHSQYAFVGTVLLVLSVSVMADVTYTADIAPIVTKHCAVCHHHDGIGPFPLLRYEDAQARAAMIGEVVATRRMPPWHADPNVGTFKNNRRLTDEEVDKVAAWVEAGSPRGDASVLTELPSFSSGWGIGKPDVIFPMPETASIPATGLVPYKNYEIPSGFSRDTWVNGIEVRPSNPKVVHHIVVTMKTSQPLSFPHGEFLGLGYGVIGSYTPGLGPAILGPGKAMLVPKNATFAVQIHYTACGRPEQDRSELGFTLAPGPPEDPVYWAVAVNIDFAIPPHAPNFRVDTTRIVPQDALLYVLNAHMHYRGKSFEFVAQYPSGRTESLLRVPDYDFNWQTDYILDKPVFLPKGTRIEAIGHFDNSTDNAANPDPTITVRHGEQTWSEMLAGGMQVTWVKDRALIRADSIANAAELADPSPANR